MWTTATEQRHPGISVDSIIQRVFFTFVSVLLFQNIALIPTSISVPLVAKWWEEIRGEYILGQVEMENRKGTEEQWCVVSSLPGLSDGNGTNGGKRFFSPIAVSLIWRSSCWLLVLNTVRVRPFRSRLGISFQEVHVDYPRPLPLVFNSIIFRVPFLHPHPPMPIPTLILTWLEAPKRMAYCTVLYQRVHK